MTKGELRKLRKERVKNGGTWTTERNDDGSTETVRTRTRREEGAHQTRMERWAKYNYEYDRD